MPPLVRTPLKPPSISPITGNTVNGRPLWSVMIPAYNCGKYLAETLESVLQQAPGPEEMQIEVCDDASSDLNVRQLVKTIGKGRVFYFGQEINVGSLRNFETCINRSRGRLIHLLHGDDKVKPGFYNQMKELFLKYPEMGAAFCRYRSVDQFNEEEMVSELERPEAGILQNWLEKLARKQRIQTPAMVVRRSVYERLGSFYGVHYGEDWEMWMRIAAHYPTGYIPEILAEYRKHDDSISGKYISTGQNIRDLKQVMQTSKRYFNANQWQMIQKDATRFYAGYAIHTARKLWGRYQNKEGTKNQIKEALNLSPNIQVLFQASKLYLKMFTGIKR